MIRSIMALATGMYGTYGNDTCVRKRDGSYADLAYRRSKERHAYHSEVFNVSPNCVPKSSFNCSQCSIIHPCHVLFVRILAHRYIHNVLASALN